MSRPTTVEEWMACDDSDQMIYVVEQGGSARKLRFFTLHTSLRVAQLVGTDDTLAAFAIGEQVADGQLPASSLESHSQRLGERAGRLWDNVLRNNFEILPESYQSAYQSHALGAISLALEPSQARQYEQTPNGKTTSTWAVDGVVFNASLALHYALLARGYNESDVKSTVLAEAQAQAQLLRDIFGNPFRPPPALDPAWLRWHDATIPRLAQQMYDSRNFAAMPILADALEEAGCTSAVILEHCRGPGPHVRGCWVVDLVLDKS